MSEHGLCPTCGRCTVCGLDQKPKVEPAVPFKPVDPNFNPPLPGWKWQSGNDLTKVNTCDDSGRG